MKPIEGSRWRHIKSGREYEIICICRIEHNFAPAYLYKGECGTLWVREMDEFLDGRFERIEDERV